MYYRYLYYTGNVLLGCMSLEGGILHSVFLLKISSLLIRFSLALWGARVRGVLRATWPVKPFENVQ